MIRINDISKFKPEKDVYLTQGTFDGVHAGHTEILKRLVQEAKEKDGLSVVLTFWPHPRMVLYPEDHGLEMLQTIDEKLAVLEEIGLDYVIILPFTKDLSRTSAATFTRDTLVNQIKVNTLVIGYDHRFGRNREGSLAGMQHLAETYDFVVKEIPAQDVDSSIVSSTKIREAIGVGNVKRASQLLGRPFSIEGKVEKGKQRGRTLGYPTANVAVDTPYKIIPKPGVYAVSVRVAGQKHFGMMNIGNSPTFALDKQRLEVHIFDFDNEIYGTTITIHFHERIRDEVRFEDGNELQAQLKKDEKVVRSYFMP